MAAAPPRCLAICRRCRTPERIASGAASIDELVAVARAEAAANGFAHARASQCLHCCDGGHTVRIELGGDEVALVGVRTVDELREVMRANDALLRDADAPARWSRRVWQRWRQGTMVAHRNLDRPD